MNQMKNKLIALKDDIEKNIADYDTQYVNRVKAFNPFLKPLNCNTLVLSVNIMEYDLVALDTILSSYDNVLGVVCVSKESNHGLWVM